MNKHPKVSILVPVYGVEKFIERCAVSLFEQTYENIEYVFVNDCTKDNSIAVLKCVIDRYPNRQSQVKIISHDKNRGLAAARNTCVENATGEFVLHVDSDDYVDKGIVSKAVSKQMVSDADVVVIDFQKAYNGFSKITHYSSFSSSKDYCLTVLARNNSNSIWAKLIRRSLYVDHKISCKEGNNQGEDFQVVPVLLYFARNIVNLSEPLYYYDCSNENAYSNSFTIDKHNQNWTSMNIVRDFFVDKGKEYEDAVQFGRVRQAVDDLIISAKAKGEVAKCYYGFAKEFLEKTDSKYFVYVSKPKRMVIHLDFSYLLMKIYVLSMRNLRHSSLRFKSLIK